MATCSERGIHPGWVPGRDASGIHEVGFPARCTADLGVVPKIPREEYGNTVPIRLNKVR